MSHPQLLRLAVAALDFELTGAERATLDAHLPGCAECRRLTARYRADMAAVGSIAFASAPSHVRAVVMDRAGRPPIRRPAWQLLMVAALLAALLAGLALGAGALLQRRTDVRSPLSWQAAPVQSSLVDDAASVTIEHAAAGNGIVLAIGRRPGGTPLFTSTDGLTWSVIGEAPSGATELAFVSTGANANQFAAIGETARGYPALWWSPDGTAWTEDVVAATPGAITNLATFEDTIVVAGYRRILSSTELPDETQFPATWRLGAGGWEALEMTGLAEGYGPAGLLVESPLGLVALNLDSQRTWVLAAGTDTFEPIGGDPGVVPTRAAWGAGRMVVAGERSDAPVIRVSEDLASWRDAGPLPEGGGTRIAALTYQSGRFVAIGDGGRGALAWTSHDGLTWTRGGEIPAGTGARMSDLAWLGPTMVAVGTRGSEGAAWTGVVAK